ncbi:MAG TPA: VWA domain-containing protein, partial [Candidatus Rifleibacterium sp.]|nr:VWA domain-containing protein [Candidatus Rifleibacterium sp.]
ARTDKFYIKEHEEETNLSGYLVMDTSGSMSYKGDGSMSKLDYASTLAASLAYLMLKQQDSVGLVTFADGLRKMIRPRTGMAHLKAVCSELEATKAVDTTDIGESLDMVGQTMKKRGIFILFSDLMDNAETIIKKLRQLRTRRHEIVLYHVLDRDEISFPFDDTTIFQDLEDKSEITTDAFALRSEYLKRVRSLLGTFRSALRKSGIDYLIADTSTPLEANLRSFFTRRQAAGER